MTDSAYTERERLLQVQPLSLVEVSVFSTLLSADAGTLRVLGHLKADILEHGCRMAVHLGAVSHDGGSTVNDNRALSLSSLSGRYGLRLGTEDDVVALHIGSTTALKGVAGRVDVSSAG